MEKRRSMWAPRCWEDVGVVGSGLGVSARGLREAQD